MTRRRSLCVKYYHSCPTFLGVPIYSTSNACCSPRVISLPPLSDHLLLPMSYSAVDAQYLFQWGFLMIVRFPFSISITLICVQVLYGIFVTLQFFG